MSDIRQKLLAVFQVEHKDHLAGIRAALAKLAQGPVANGELDEAFRRAHSLKGAARAVDLHELETLAHRLETLFARVRDGGLQLDKPIITVIHAVLDTTEDMMTALAENRAPANVRQALASIDQVLGTEPQTPTETPATTPAVAENHQAPAMFKPVDTLRVNAEHLDQVLRSTGQLLTENMRLETVAHQLSAISGQIAEIEKEWQHVRRHSAAALRRLSDAPEFSRVVRYLNFMEHRSRSLTSQSRSLRLLHQQSAWSVRNLTEQLQQDVRRARMVPAEAVFEGFHKMIRDLARDEKKDIAFQATGFEVEADRMVLQSLKDPVMHMLRNAVSHGLEAPEERQQTGKDPVGHVSLQIETQGNRLQVTVEDDGRGINWKQVAEAALRKGLLDSSAAAGSTPQDLAHLLFQPGFSTAKFVTELSGRGMGLSIVVEAVARLQGEVRVPERAGPGSAIVLSVPLSVSTHRLLLVACQNQSFAIPLHGIERVDRIKLAEVENVEGRSVIRLRGKVLPLLSLAHVLGIGDPAVQVEGETVPVVIARSGAKRVAIAVDALLTQMDGLILNPPSEISGVKKVVGCILRGDGAVMLVLNPAELVEALQQTSGAPALTTAKPEPEAIPPSILVVDDSITTRTLEKSILEAHGYQVAVAVDGVEALNHLRSQPVDLVISDIQMPRLDGFGLLEEIKRDNRLSKLPVILVTSLENRADQERGMALGADAYIVKRKFDQRNLMETIRQIL